MTKLLLDKRAIITGASRGVGRAFAAALSAAGATVILMARASADLDAATAEIGNGATAIACNVSQPDPVRAAFTIVATMRLDNVLDTGIAKDWPAENAAALARATQMAATQTSRERRLRLHGIPGAAEPDHSPSGF